MPARRNPVKVTRNTPTNTTTVKTLGSLTVNRAAAKRAKRPATNTAASANVNCLRILTPKS